MVTLFFSKCFRAEFEAFPKLKYSVKGGTNSSKLCIILVLKTYLIFISRVVVHSLGHY